MAGCLRRHPPRPTSPRGLTHQPPPKGPTGTPSGRAGTDRRTHTAPTRSATDKDQQQHRKQPPTSTRWIQAEGAPAQQCAAATRLIIGKRNASAIGTLVERSTGFTMLVRLPEGYKPEQVAPALAAKIQTLPEAVRRSLTWDQGPEMRDWKQVKVAVDIETSSAIRTSPGSAARTRTPTACCASTSPRAATCPCTPRPIWTGSPPSSTTAPQPPDRRADHRAHRRPRRHHHGPSRSRPRGQG
jgi:hypothetical protein